MLATLLMAVYFGDLHIHTVFSSDAVGDPSVMFLVARYIEDLDFIAITDHDTTMSAAEWEQTKLLAQNANVPNIFVAFSGIEWTYGIHIALYFLNDDEAFCPTCNDMRRFNTFYGPIVTQGRAGAHIAHPNSQGPLGVVDNDVLRNVESLNGRSYQIDQEYGPKGFVSLLGQGMQLGFVGTSDDHSYDGTGEAPRKLGDWLTGCHAESLTRAGILDALKNRRCFATDNLRTVVDLAVGNFQMGTAGQFCEGRLYPADLTVTGTKTPTRVEIVKDGTVVASRTNCTSPTCNLSTTVRATAPFSNVYGRVFHDKPTTGCAFCKTYASPVKLLATQDTVVCSSDATPLPSMGQTGLAVAVLCLATTAALVLWRRRAA